MHHESCGCPKCAESEAFEAEAYSYGGQGELESGEPFSEAEELELALELMNVSSEAELDQFLGKVFKKAVRGIKKVGRVVGRVAKPFSGVLRAVAKKALPFVGGALGSLIPIPGVGTAVGSALGGAIGKALELETNGLSLEDQEFEMARRFVRVAGSAARQAVLAPPGVGAEHVVRNAVAAAARKHLPRARLPAGVGAGSGQPSGRWVRRGRHIILLGT